MAAALTHAADAIRHCERCNTFTEDTICALCRSAKRDPALLCVVETPADLLMVEQTQAYQGLYFVLMGRLSPLDGIGPKEIRLDRLLKRATDGVVHEVILATNFTNEGEATAHYIGELLTARGLEVSRLARGVPVGGELEYVDAGTLAQALRERRPLGAVSVLLRLRTIDAACATLQSEWRIALLATYGISAPTESAGGHSAIAEPRALAHPAHARECAATMEEA